MFAVEAGSVAVRQRGNKDLGVMPVDDFAKIIKQDVADRVLW